MNLYKTCTAEPYYFLVTDAILAWNNLSHFRKNLLDEIWKLIMMTDDKIRDEKLRFNINRDAVLYH